MLGFYYVIILRGLGTFLFLYINRFALMIFVYLDIRIMVFLENYDFFWVIGIFFLSIGFYFIKYFNENIFKNCFFLFFINKVF